MFYAQTYNLQVKHPVNMNTTQTTLHKPLNQLPVLFILKQSKHRFPVLQLLLTKPLKSRPKLGIGDRITTVRCLTVRSGWDGNPGG
jgi:hypothetical protein